MDATWASLAEYPAKNPSMPLSSYTATAFSMGESFLFSLNVFVRSTSPGWLTVHANIDAKNADTTVVSRRVSSFGIARDALVASANRYVAKSSNATCLVTV